MIAKIGEWVKRHRHDLWVAFCAALVGWSAYNLGYARGHLAAEPAERQARIRMETDSPSPLAELSTTPPPKASSPRHTDPRVVASKASTSKRYHFSWCPGANKIKEANRLWFDTESAAIAAGYTLAANCKR